MAIYVFSLLVGYIISGVDRAQGVRHKFLEKSGRDVKYIYEKTATERELKLYSDMGIPCEDMISIPIFMADNNLHGNCKVSLKLQELKEKIGFSSIEEIDDSIKLFKDNVQVATIFLKENKEFFSKIYFFSYGKLVISEHYAESLLYTKFYTTVSVNGILEAQHTRTSFFNIHGKHVFDCLYDSNLREKYIYPNGQTLSSYELCDAFIKKLNLSKADILLMDRPTFLPYVQGIFSNKGEAKMICFLHSGHYYEEMEEPNAIYLNYEYYAWFKYSKELHKILVSTKEQKYDLQQKLKEFQCNNVEVDHLLISGLNKLEISCNNRKSNSVLTVSRLEERKHIEWIILVLVKVHKIITNVTLDIYGTGRQEYIDYLKKLVEINDAGSYICFKGYADTKGLYVNYDMYITTSTWETLGLSVMEAIGSGNAVVGLNVRYGNRLFIEDGKNGRLIDFCPADSNNPEKVEAMINEMADAIVEIFQDEEKLRAYQEHSYMIAERFLNDKIEKRWLEVLETL